jgi:hypothetical protein
VRDPSSGHELKLPGREEGGGVRSLKAEEGAITKRRCCGEYSNWTK